MDLRIGLLLPLSHFDGFLHSQIINVQFNGREVPVRLKFHTLPPEFAKPAKNPSDNLHAVKIAHGHTRPVALDDVAVCGKVDVGKIFRRNSPSTHLPIKWEKSRQAIDGADDDVSRFEVSMKEGGWLAIAPPFHLATTGLQKSTLGT